MKNSLHRLVNLVAAKDNPHDLINEVAADAELLRVAQQLYQRREKPFVEDALPKDISELCRIHRIPVDHFYERLGLVARILNLEGKQRDYYRILGIARNAARQEIKHAFRKRSLANHPDTNPGDPGAVERFRDILHAYEILSNDNLRNHYDRALESPGWVEHSSEDLEGKPSGAGRKWPCLWPAVALLAVLLLTVFVVDYQRLMTDKYYHSKAKVRSGQPRSSSVKWESTSLQQPMPDIAACVGSFQIARERSAWPGSQARDGGLISNTESAAKEESQIPARSSISSPMSPPAAGSAGNAAQPKAQKAPAKQAATASTTTAAAAHPKSEPQRAGETTRQASAVEPEREKKQERKGIAEPPAKTVKKPASTVVAASSERDALSRKLETKPDGSPAKKSGGNATEKSKLPEKKELSVSDQQRDIVAFSDQRNEPVLDLQKRVENFLRRYTQAYQQKNLTLFLGFFETDALENGQPVMNLASTYLKTFSNTEQILFQIELQKCSQTSDGVSAKGKFRLQVRSSSRDPVKSSGPIRFRLVDRGNDFRVKNLEYSFANQKL